MNETVRILLVEDSPTDILLAREALSRTPLVQDLRVVENGEEALDFLHGRGAHATAERPDMILLDLNLPRLGGWEVLREIKRHESLKYIPVIILTTSGSPDDVLRSYGMYANCFITKPVDFQKFQSVMAQIEAFWFRVARLPGEVP